MQNGKANVTKTHFIRGRARRFTSVRYAAPARNDSPRKEDRRRRSGIERATPWEVARLDQDGELIVREGGPLPTP
jgi:hypothetical protein